MSAIYPPGIILPYAGLVTNDNPLPAGWLLCDGSAITRSNPYNDLFKVIGTRYTAVDDGTTFNLPDLRGRIVAGLETMSNTAPNTPPVPPRLTLAAPGGVNGSTLGAVGGTETHLLLATESGLVEHSHRTYTASQSNTTTGENASRLTAQLPPPESPEASGFLTSTAPATPAAEAHNNVQPTIVLNYMIKI